MRAVVDHGIGARRLGTLELLVAARRQKDECPMHLGEGQCEAGDAARPKNCDCFAALDMRAFDHRMPCGERRAGQGGSLLETETRRHCDRPGLLKQCVFGENAVDHAAQRMTRCIRRNSTAGPVDEKRACYPVAGLELRDARSDGRNFAGAVRQRNDGKFRVAISALDDALIAIIQRRRPHFHDDLAMAGLGLGASGVENEPIDPGGFTDFVCLHEGSLWLSSMPATLLSALRRLPNMAIPSSRAFRLTAWPRAPGNRGGGAFCIGFACLMTCAICATRAPYRGAPEKPSGLSTRKN